MTKCGYLQVALPAAISIRYYIFVSYPVCYNFFFQFSSRRNSFLKHVVNVTVVH